MCSCLITETTGCSTAVGPIMADPVIGRSTMERSIARDSAHQGHFSFGTGSIGDRDSRHTVVGRVLGMTEGAWCRAFSGEWNRCRVCQNRAFRAKPD
jgi:hypothetical protein